MLHQINMGGVPIQLSQQDIQTAKPVLTPEERAACLKEIDEVYKKLGYNEDEIIKMPLKHIVKASQVASEATLSACIKYLESVPDSLKAYITANVLPEDYRNEIALSREVNRLSNEVRSLRLELTTMKDMLNELSPATNESE